MRKMLVVMIAVLVTAAAVTAVPAQENKPEELTPAAGPEGGEMTVVASPEEYKRHLEAERQAIAREREALVALREQVKKDMEDLIALQKTIEDQLAAQDKREDEKIKKLVKIYSTMRPDEVTPLIMSLDEDTALRVLYQMKPKIQAEVLALMSPALAADLSKKILRKDF
ncbi:MAG: hypothetical protein M5R36_13445 [Deltaproteobacteria bacterium]|nr:hypothetical protein [Deltaproteobacteria bacterium]